MKVRDYIFVLKKESEHVLKDSKIDSDAKTRNQSKEIQKITKITKVKKVTSKVCFYL